MALGRVLARGRRHVSDVSGSQLTQPDAQALIRCPVVDLHSRGYQTGATHRKSNDSNEDGKESVRGTR